MKSYRATIEINAAPATIWSILTDASKYTEWDEQMIELKGSIAPQEKLHILTKLAPDRAFTPAVTEYTENKHMVWSSRMPLGLFSGVRTFTLEELSAETTRFTLTEEFSGLLLPLFGGGIPDMNPIFATFAKALKDRAEAM